jgi:cell division inhibitor SulA
MSRVTQFRSIVRRSTGGNAARALRFGQYLVEMGIGAEEWASARAQLTRAMRAGGSLSDLVDQGLILPDVANRQPYCFVGRTLVVKVKGGGNVHG